MELNDILIRPIEPADNRVLAGIIRNTLAEFGANRPGTVYFDPTTDHLFELFSQQPMSEYFVAAYHGQVLGGGGIFPSKGLPADTCELVKMYLLPPARGLGLGKKLLGLCVNRARALGYTKMYIETISELKQAIRTYEKFGFTLLKEPIGETGHFGCDLHMIMPL